MEEHNGELTPPRRHRPSRGRVWARRSIWAAIVVVALVRGEDDPPPEPVVAPLKVLRVIFPEGFTRQEMADRVAAVREIAISKRHVTPRLTRSGYLAATSAAIPPAEFRKDWPGDRIE